MTSRYFTSASKRPSTVVPDGQGNLSPEVLAKGNLFMLILLICQTNRSACRKIRCRRTESALLIKPFHKSRDAVLETDSGVIAQHGFGFRDVGAGDVDVAGLERKLLDANFLAAGLAQLGN